MRSVLQDIIVHKSALMHHVLQAVGRGYTHHAAGTVTAQRVETLIENMSRLYGIDHSPDKRWREKRAGRAAARLFIHPDYQPHETPFFRWWLLLTEGEHPAIEREEVGD